MVMTATEGHTFLGCLPARAYQIWRCRRKLKESPSDPKYIYTELGIGYRMLED